MMTDFHFACEQHFKSAFGYSLSSETARSIHWPQMDFMNELSQEICRVASRACLLKTVMIPVCAYRCLIFCVPLRHFIPFRVCYGNPGFQAHSGVGDTTKAPVFAFQENQQSSDSIMKQRRFSEHLPGVFAYPCPLCGDVMHPVAVTEVSWCRFGWNSLFGLKASMHLHSDSVEPGGALVDHTQEPAAVPQRGRRRTSEAVITNGILEFIDLRYLCFQLPLKALQPLFLSTEILVSPCQLVLQLGNPHLQGLRWLPYRGFFYTGGQTGLL